MPFSLGNYTEYASFYALGSANGNSLCIEHCLTAVNKKYEDSRIAIIVPEGILFDRKFTKLRKHIYQNSYVENIISLPTGTFAPYSNVKTSIIYLTRKKNEQKFIWHYEVKNDGYTLNTKREKKEGKNDLDTFLSFRDSSEEEKLSQDGFSKLDMKLVEENDYISIPNVYKKFAFDTKHKIIPLGELVEEVNLRNQDNFPVWSVTNDEGFMLAEKRFSERVASDNTSNYKIVPPNYFAYSPPRINVGSINYNNTINTGCVSPLYVVFKVKKEEIIIPKYLFLLFQSEEFKEQVKSYAFGSVRQTLSFENFVKITVPVPFLEEQEKVITELTNIKKMIKNAGEIIKELNNRLSLSLSLSLLWRNDED